MTEPGRHMITMLTTERTDAKTMLGLKILTPIILTSQSWVPGNAKSENKLFIRAQKSSLLSSTESPFPLPLYSLFGSWIASVSADSRF